MTTLILDTNWGCKIPRWAVCTIVTIVSALISLIYCTEFGLQALDAVDTYVNDVALFFTGSYALSDGIGWSANIPVVWCETFAATSLYRCRDVANQVGWPSYLIYTIGFAVAQGLGIRVAYGSTPGIGAGVGFAFFFASTFIALFAARTPGIPAPRFWGNSKFMSRFWWVAFYPGNQLTRDLNVLIGVGKNWNIPYFWAAIMKVCSRKLIAHDCTALIILFHSTSPVLSLPLSSRSPIRSSRKRICTTPS